MVGKIKLACKRWLRRGRELVSVLFNCGAFAGRIEEIQLNNIRTCTQTQTLTLKHKNKQTNKQNKKNRPCWLIQARSSRPIGAWSNPVIRPNRCCWQNNKQGGQYGSAAPRRSWAKLISAAAGSLAGWSELNSTPLRHTGSHGRICFLVCRSRFVLSAVSEATSRAKFQKEYKKRQDELTQRLTDVQKGKNNPQKSYKTWHFRVASSK